MERRQKGKGIASSSNFDCVGKRVVVQQRLCSVHMLSITACQYIVLVYIKHGWGKCVKHDPDTQVLFYDPAYYWYGNPAYAQHEFEENVGVQLYIFGSEPLLVGSALNRVLIISIIIIYVGMSQNSW